MVPSEVEVRAQLTKILRSDFFTGSARSSAFIHFCIEQKLSGNTATLKESIVGVEVFGRAPDYDPKSDAIVRVHARRVREKLEQYYSETGQHDIIEITLPRGTYIPEITKRLPTPSPLVHTWEETVAEPVPPPVRPVPRVHWLWLLLAIALPLSAGILWLVRDHRNGPLSGDGAMAASVPFTSFQGSELFPAWSPHGDMLAYAWDEGHEDFPHIFLEKTGETQPHRLTGAAAAEFRPVWSPDGSQIAFLRRVQANSFEIVRRAIASGQESVVTSVPYYWPLTSDPPALDWSPDGASLLISEQPSPADPVSLFLVNIATGQMNPVTHPPYGTSGDIEAKFSPDGSQIAFRRGGLGDLYTTSSSGESQSGAHQLTYESDGIRGISWSPDGRSIYFGSRHGGEPYAIWKIDAAGGSPLAVTPADAPSIDPSVSHDGRELAFERHDLVVNLVEVSIKNPNHRRSLNPSSKLDESPSLSPDGNSLAFISNRSGSQEAWLTSLDGSGLQQITHLGATGIPLQASWSPDGHALLMTIRISGATNVFKYSLADHSMRQLTHSRGRLLSPLYSPDGRYIYFSSNAEGATRIWRISDDGRSNPEPMFGDIAMGFQQSSDGRYLYYLGNGPTLRILRRDMKTGTLDTVYESNREFLPSSLMSFSMRGKELYLLLAEKDKAEGYLVAFDTDRGTLRTVLHLEHAAQNITQGIATSIAGFAITPDGESVIFAEVELANTDIYRLALPR